MSGSILLVLALCSLAGLGVCHKVADFMRCRPDAINVMLFFWAAVVLCGYTFLYKVHAQNIPLFPPFTVTAVLLAVACGMSGSIAILTFQTGVRYGRISTSWLVINLSTVLPAVLSLVIYQEWKQKINWQLPAGLVLVILSVLFLWKDKQEEIKRGEEPIPQSTNGF
jgi:drug/metabolite transporter (DMT)-like permease